MSNSVDQVIAKIAFAFNRIFNDFKGIYLFGVHTDGKLHEDEDIELAAIFDIEDKSKREQIWPIIGKIETEMDVCIDLYPYTEESFKKDEEIYNEVMEEGIFYNNKGQRAAAPDNQGLK
ncbi:MAG TPA: nucleotidyltransferase domain-containing protein [Candidatus Stercorousia faecigallinarum]|nr:nucleotidyltransferase domain-containing protein [Candidatus Stercorousia faecigallinarum]